MKPPPDAVVLVAVDSARAYHRHAIDVARRQGERWSELRATISIARLALDGGAQRRRRATRDELAALVASFSEGFSALLGREHEVHVLPDLLTTSTDRNIYAAADIVIGVRFTKDLPRTYIGKVKRWQLLPGGPHHALESAEGQR